MAIALLVGACGGSSDEAAPTPEPTVEIAAAPTATSAPATEPTATPAPTATPEPTAAPDMTVEEEVIAAWERYWDLAVQARGEDPPPEALAFSTYTGGDQLTGLEELIARQREEGYFLTGRVTVGDTRVEMRSTTSAVVDDCVEVDFKRFAVDDGSELSSQSEMRVVRARLEFVDELWRVFAVETGDGC